MDLHAETATFGCQMMIRVSSSGREENLRKSQSHLTEELCFNELSYETSTWYSGISVVE